MNLINCPACDAKVSVMAASCPSCGHPILKQQSPKSLAVYIILGLLFGIMGFHDFYSGRNVSGAVKIGLMMLGVFADASAGFSTGFVVVFAVLCACWAIGSLLFVRTDANGVRMS